ncbi:GntR family transcriptional regulator [Kineococcus sp. TBRC 1896]|uniref:GntR family transcriptional regulator n=1 Tax=Kineococcus mangrovi TaxID=1660183 RepID=A0ABV4I5R3_9ACTN
MGDAYELIRRAVLTMELLPGQPLSERGLETLAGASRTPVRAALVQLAHDGLTVRDGRGWRVAPLDLDEVRAVVEHREVVERGAVALAVERATDAELDAVQVLAQSPAEDAVTGLRDGAQFHVALARLSRNDFLAGAVDGTLTRLARTRWLEVRSGASREQARAEHLAILTAVRDRDADRAATLVREHARGTRDRLLAHLEADRLGLRSRGVAVVGVRAGTG